MQAGDKCNFHIASYAQASACLLVAALKSRYNANIRKFNARLTEIIQLVVLYGRPITWRLMGIKKIGQ